MAEPYKSSIQRRREYMEDLANRLDREAEARGEETDEEKDRRLWGDKLPSNYRIEGGSCPQ